MTREGVISAGMKTNDKDVWEALHDMHTALGIDGGSSDESDCEPNSKKVIVREKPWRNRRVKAAYKVIDNFTPKVTGLGRQLPGNPGRPRVGLTPRGGSRRPWGVCPRPASPGADRSARIGGAADHRRAIARASDRLESG